MNILRDPAFWSRWAPAIQAGSAFAIVLLTLWLVHVTRGYAKTTKDATGIALRAPSIEAARRLLMATNGAGKLIAVDESVSPKELEAALGAWMDAYGDTYTLIQDKELEDRVIGAARGVNIALHGLRTNTFAAQFGPRLDVVLAEVGRDLGRHVSGRPLADPRRVPSFDRAEEFMSASGEVDVLNYVN